MTGKQSATWKLITLVLTIVILVVAACGPTPEPQVVKETVMVTEKETVVVTEKEEIEVTKVVKEEVEVPVEVVVTATPEPTEPKTLVIAYPEQYSENFDISTMVYAMEPTHMIYDTLVSVDHDYEYQPGALTDRWEVSEDGTVVTFYLKEGITFHDGSDFNAGVVKWWLEEMVKEAKCCAYMYTAITEIEVIDDYTIALHFEGPFPALFYYLSGSWGLIMSKSEYDGCPAARSQLGLHLGQRSQLPETGPLADGLPWNRHYADCVGL